MNPETSPHRNSSQRRAVRTAVGLLADDGAVALAVVIAALLAVPLGPSNTAGWVLFGLVWLALAASLWRARPSR